MKKARATARDACPPKRGRRRISQSRFPPKPSPIRPPAGWVASERDAHRIRRAAPRAGLWKNTLAVLPPGVATSSEGSLARSFSRPAGANEPGRRRSIDPSMDGLGATTTTTTCMATTCRR